MSIEELLGSLDRHFMAGCPTLAASQLAEHWATGNCPECRDRAERLAREPCEEDSGPRRCCGTPQLGPHDGTCSLSPSMQDAIGDHEQMYSHETEAVS